MSEVSKDAGKQKHLPSLDGVRGLAIVMVLLTHFGSTLADGPMVEGSIKQILLRGGYGVEPVLRPLGVPDHGYPAG